MSLAHQFDDRAVSSAIRRRLEELQASVDDACPPSTAPYTKHKFKFYQKFDNIDELASKTIRALVIGRDFYNEADLNNGKDAPTDERIDKILCAAGYDLKWVGFVNAWPVLRAGSHRVCGDHPMSKDKEFTAVCRSRIDKIIPLLSIEIVITLGNAPANCVSVLIGEKNLFSASAPVVKDGRVYVAISHPALPNHVRRERKLGRSERSMLEEALQINKSLRK
jgi:hypothetical protein